MERYLGTTKYDAKIRRITLKKEIAEYMGMEEGDYVDYFRIGEDIVIRKRPKDHKNATDINTIVPPGTKSEDVNLIMNAAQKISGHYKMGQQPDNMEMIKIVAEVMQTFPPEYPEDRKLEMLDMSIRVAKELFSKVRITIMGNPEKRN